jgi:hypothetical protein
MKRKTKAMGYIQASRATVLTLLGGTIFVFFENLL